MELVSKLASVKAKEKLAAGAWQEKLVKWSLIFIGAAFLVIMMVLPLVLIGVEALAKGWNAYVRAVSEPFAQKALWLTAEATILAVLSNTVFGLAAAWLLTKFDFKGKSLLGAIIDLPFAVSLFGRLSPFYDTLQAYQVAVVFAVPGIVLATIFVTLPFIARSIVPVMEAQGRQEEEAAALMGASGWRIFWQITLPNIKWGLLYGIILCSARAMGEFGAVSVVSGHIRGKTNTLPLHIEILYNEYNFTAAFAVASILVILAVVVLILRNLVEWRLTRAERTGEHEL